MARIFDRVAYRLAGFVWTAIYSGLSGGRTELSGGRVEILNQRYAVIESAMPAESRPTTFA